VRAPRRPGDCRIGIVWEVLDRHGDESSTVVLSRGLDAASPLPIRASPASGSSWRAQSLLKRPRFARCSPAARARPRAEEPTPRPVRSWQRPMHELPSAFERSRTPRCRVRKTGLRKRLLPRPRGLVLTAAHVVDGVTKRRRAGAAQGHARQGRSRVARARRRAAHHRGRGRRVRSRASTSTRPPSTPGATSTSCAAAARGISPSRSRADRQWRAHGGRHPAHPDGRLRSAPATAAARSSTSRVVPSAS